MLSKVIHKMKRVFGKDEESNLVSHARTELELAGLFDEDSDYGGMIGDAVLDLVRAFAAQGHSGMSAGLAIGLFEKLARFKPLGPLTGEESEWTHLGYNDEMEAQNRRCSHIFRRADGTAYDIEAVVFEEPNGARFTSKDSVRDIEFPYTPKPRIEKVDEAA